MKEIIVNRNDAGQRIDKLLTKLFPALPQSMLYKAIRKKRINPQLVFGWVREGAFDAKASSRIYYITSPCPHGAASAR